jgi:hypothetical protein
MTAITLYPVICINGPPGYPLHVFLVDKIRADAQLAGQVEPYLECPECHTRNPASVVQANTIVTTT